VHQLRLQILLADVSAADEGDVVLGPLQGGTWGRVVRELMKAMEKRTFDMKAVVEIELIRLIIHNNDGKIAEAIESAGSRIERL